MKECKYKRIYIGSSEDIPTWTSNIKDAEHLNHTYLLYLAETKTVSARKLKSLEGIMDVRKEKLSSEDNGEPFRGCSDFLKNFLSLNKDNDLDCELCFVGNKLKPLYDYLVNKENKENVKDIINSFTEVHYFGKLSNKMPKESLKHEDESREQLRLDIGNNNDDSSDTCEESIVDLNEIDKNNSEDNNDNLNDTKAKLMLKLQNRLIQHISQKLFKTKNTIVLDNKQMVQFLRLILISTSEKEFEESWSSVEQSIKITLTHEDFLELQDESRYYNTIATYLYPMDHWDY